MKKIWVVSLWCFLIAYQIAFAQEPVVFRVGYVPLISQLPLIVAYENARLEYRDFAIEIVKYSSFTALEAALRVGAIEAASIPVPIALSIAAETEKSFGNVPIMIVGTVHRGGSMLITTAGDESGAIRGALLGVPGQDSSENLYLMRTLSNRGLRFGLDYKTIDIPFEATLQHLRNGTIQGGYLPEPFGTMAEQNGLAIAVADQDDLLAENLLTVLVINTVFLNTHTLVVEAWLKDLVRSTKFIEEDIALAGGQQTALLQILYLGYPQDLVMESLRERKGAIRFSYSFPALEELQEIMRLAFDVKLLMKSVELESLLATNLVKQSVDILNNETRTK